MSTASRQMVIDIGVRMRARDNVELIGDLYRPSQDGKWPTLLLRSPYDRTNPRGSMVIVDPAWLARQGFAVLVQDARGRGESDGEFDPFHQEFDDGFDTVEWAASQPWSTGAVGIYGSSYMGISTYQAVAAQPPHLRAALAFTSTPNPRLRVYGGLFEASSYSWYALLIALMTVGRLKADAAEKGKLLGRLVGLATNPGRTAAVLPMSDIDILSDSDLAPFWKEWLSEPDRGVKERSLAQNFNIGKVSLLQVTGYRDLMAHDVFRLAERLSGNPEHRLIAGPWAHRGLYSGSTGSRELLGTSSPAGPLGWGPLIAAWFDIKLRGGTGAQYPEGLAWLQGEPVRYYLEGVDRWVSAPSWPPRGTPREWCLTSAGDARSARGNGKLLSPSALAREHNVDRFETDPKDPFPTCGGALLVREQGPDGIQDQRAVDQRYDLLVYTSEPLESPVRIAGPQKLILHLSSNVPDADICATLVDVEPSGFAYNLSEGFQRTRYRHGGNADWLKPGEIHQIDVLLHDTAHVFKAGHRIRVMIAGANFPRLSRNLHTRTIPEFGTLAEAVVGTHEVHHGPAHRSCLLLNELDGETHK